VTVADNSAKRAVALRYDTSQDAAPKVVAKGQGAQAETILAIARRNNVPIREDRALVTVLSKLDLDQQIPPQLYAAVATLLAFLYRTNQATPRETQTQSV
jgi:flagellar biosynthesis protein